MSTATIKINLLRQETEIASIPPSRLADVFESVYNEIHNGDNPGGTGPEGPGGNASYPIVIKVSEACTAEIGSTTHNLAAGITTINADTYKIWVSSDYEGETLELDLSGITLQNGDLGRVKLRLGRAKNVKIIADTSGMTLMNDIVSSCEYVEHIDLSSFDSSNVQSMNGMFLSCIRLETIDISNLDISNVTQCFNMFFSCLALKEIKCTPEFKTWALENSESNKLPEHVYFDTGETISWSSAIAPGSSEYPHGGLFELTQVCAGITPLSKAGEVWKMTVDNEGEVDFEKIS